MGLLLEWSGRDYQIQIDKYHDFLGECQQFRTKALKL
jgi:hypothetical protein